MCGCLSRAPYWGPGLQPRRVPSLGIKLMTLWFTGQQSTGPHQPGHILVLFLFIDEREGKNIDLVFHPFTHSLLDFCICPGQGSNPQPWHVETTLKPTELPTQGALFIYLLLYYYY